MRTRFDGLCEFVSRKGRMNVLNTLIEELGNQKEVAKRLKITKNAVSGWIRYENRHPSNENAFKMLKILSSENESKFKELLIDELQLFQRLILEFRT